MVKHKNTYFLSKIKDYTKKHLFNNLSTIYNNKTLLIKAKKNASIELSYLEYLTLWKKFYHDKKDYTNRLYCFIKHYFVCTNKHCLS
jgi:hypothetical protein